MIADRGAPVSLRLQALVYTVAFFAGSQFLMVSVVMPLWALQLTASPFLIGLIVSSRQILVVTLSIYGGGLLDRFGPKRVIMLLGLGGTVLTALFPALDFVWAAIILQMATGFAEVTSWIGAQSLLGRLLHGAPVYAGRMTAAVRFGGFLGPVLVGLVWQHFGPVAGFGMMASWFFATVVSAWFLPATVAVGAPISADDAPPIVANDAQPVSRLRSGAKSFFADYATTLRLLALPAVALVICATFMRQAGSGIQSSFYGVWLKEVGFDAAAIGLLIGISNGVSALAALTLGPMARIFKVHWLLIAMTILAVAAIAITPLLGSFIALAIAIGLRGVGQGLNFPLMLTISSQAVGQHLQGRVVALRISFNKLGGALVPLIMGAVAELVGIETAFYLMGGVGVLALIALGVWVAMTPAFAGGSLVRHGGE